LLRGSPLRGVESAVLKVNAGAIAPRPCPCYDILIDKRISKVVQAPGFIRGINRKSKIENPQAPEFIRGVNLKSKI
jgi:hypothetical protein